MAGIVGVGRWIGIDGRRGYGMKVMPSSQIHLTSP